MKISRIIICLICAFVIFFGPLVAMKKITAKTDEFESQKAYKGIISLWHVDTFEGGTGSRGQFLLDTACGFEKAYNGILISVETHTINSVETNLSKGITPDLISFGNGLEEDRLVALNTSGDFKGAKLDNNLYAVPWCRGGYALIANPKKVNDFSQELDDLVISKSQYNQPLVALLEEEYKVLNFQVLSPMDAYVKFVNGNTKYMLGTQRDINRLERRGMEVKVKALTKFNDLNQYIAIMSKDSAKKFYAERFIEYLISEKVQEKLVKIGMMSAIFNIPQENSTLAEMQKITKSKTISMFTSKDDLVKVYEESIKAINGDSQSVKNIKNILL